MWRNRFFEYEIDGELIFRVSGYIIEDAYVVSSIRCHKPAEISSFNIKKFIELFYRTLRKENIRYIKFPAMGETDKHLTVGI